MSAPAPNNTTATATSTAPVSSSPITTQTTNELLPGTATLLQASKLAIAEDRAIMLDYFRQTANSTAFLGEDPKTKERVLIKSKDEFTSLIKKTYKSGDDFIILTENSLYIVSGKIQVKRVDLSKLQEAYDSSF